MKDERERDKHSLTRILVLGATFFMVGLCPVVDPALAIFTAGTAVYSFLWWYESYENHKEK